MDEDAKALLAELQQLSPGLLLARIREEQGFTQAALAKAAGISRPYLTQLENETRPLTDAVSRKLVAALGLGEAAVPILRGQITAEDIALSKRWVELIDRLKESVSPEDFADLIALAEEPGNAAWALRMTSVQDALSPRAQEPVPGWSRLTKPHRKLVQQIVEKLLAAQSAEGVGTDADQA